MDFDLCQIICTVIADINRFRFKRKMPGHVVLFPEPSKADITRGFGEIGALRRRMKLTAGPHNTRPHFLSGESKRGLKPHRANASMAVRFSKRYKKIDFIWKTGFYCQFSQELLSIQP